MKESSIVLESCEYISDRLTKGECDRWGRGDTILLVGNCGTGKTTFILDYFSKWYPDRKILILSNRALLKEQYDKDIDLYECGNVTAVTYQLVEQHMNDIIGTMGNQWDYIIFDECHYLINDSDFNDHTDLIVRSFGSWIHPCKIMITATPWQLSYWQNSPFGNKLSIEYYYSFHKDNDQYKLNFIRGSKFIDGKIHDIIFNTNDKIIVFSNSIDKKLLYLHRKYPKASSFICSKGNEKYIKYNNDRETDLISREQRFDARMLLSTRVMDNGISIKDANVKWIFVMDNNPINIVQEIGRVRLAKGQILNVFVLLPESHNLVSTYRSFSEKKQRIDDFWGQIENPSDNVVKAPSSSFMYGWRGMSLINTAKYFSLEYKCDLYNVRNKETSGTIIELVSERLGVSSHNIKENKDGTIKSRVPVFVEKAEPYFNKPLGIEDKHAIMEIVKKYFWMSEYAPSHRPSYKGIKGFLIKNKIASFGVGYDMNNNKKDVMKKYEK